MGRLEGKVALITGSGRGIGRGIALRFAAEGARLGILDLDQESCQAVMAEIEGLGGQAIALPASVTNDDEVIEAVHKLTDTFGSISILVNNAAVIPAGCMKHRRRILTSVSA